ncbi:MAG: flagellin lysine-N-methylase [Fibrobacteraceae bacterium]
MLVRVPDFYKRFHCKADKCTDTCCIGWEIDVDEHTNESYQKIKAPFGEKLKTNIQNGHFVLKEGERCPFLNTSNLCEIYKKLGQNALCDICREHPRFVEVFGDVKEEGLGLACEEAARLLLEKNEPLHFQELEDLDYPDEISEKDIITRNKIFAEREEIFKELSNRKKALNARIKKIFQLAAVFDGYSQEEFIFDKETILKMLQKCESYGSVWDKAFVRIEQSNGVPENIFSEMEGERIIAYIIFRYYAKCLFDGNRRSKVKFAILFWEILSRYTKELALPISTKQTQKIDATKLLSKQLEYSEENMKIFI